MSALPVCLSHVPPLRSWAQSQEQLADAMVTLKELLSAGTPSSPCLCLLTPDLGSDSPLCLEFGSWPPVSPSPDPAHVLSAWSPLRGFSTPASLPGR